MFICDIFSYFSAIFHEFFSLESTRYLSPLVLCMGHVLGLPVLLRFRTISANHFSAPIEMTTLYKFHIPQGHLLSPDILESHVNKL